MKRDWVTNWDYVPGQYLGEVTGSGLGGRLMMWDARMERQPDGTYVVRTQMFGDLEMTATELLVAMRTVFEVKDDLGDRIVGQTQRRYPQEWDDQERTPVLVRHKPPDTTAHIPYVEPSETELLALSFTGPGFDNTAQSALFADLFERCKQARLNTAELCERSGKWGRDSDKTDEIWERLGARLAEERHG